MTTISSLLDHERTDDDIRQLGAEFETTPPEAILRWALEEFGAEVALATGFGPEGCVLIHLLAGISREVRIFYLDTDLLFHETHQLRDRLMARYGVQFERRATTLSLRHQSAQFGEKLWESRPDECCRLRKVEPLVETLASLRAWITGIRRDQSPARANAGVIERDAKFGLIKINPLARWSAREVWNFIQQHEVPYNPLHDEGYPSIGCRPCTTLVQIGEDPRAGRWRGMSKTECGLHK